MGNQHFRKMPHISSVGGMIFDPVWSRKFHHSDNHELLHVIRGEMILVYDDGREYPARQGDVLINPAGIVHRDSFDPVLELDVFFIRFDWTCPNNFFSVATNDRLSGISTDSASEIGRIFDAMRCDCGVGDFDRIIAESRLLNILLLLFRDLGIPHYPNQDAPRKNRNAMLIEKAKRYIERRFGHPVGLDDVAEYLQISPFHLSRVFSSGSDFSFVQYLTEIRINEAKKLLIEGRHIVSDVAKMVGYEDCNYFSKVFKAHVGCPPSKYR